MNELLLAIYDRFFKPDVPETLNQEIDTCHRQLIDTLTREERKILLQLIDDKDHIAEKLSIDSFIRGFQLAYQLSAEISIYEKNHSFTSDPIEPIPKGGDTT